MIFCVLRAAFIHSLRVVSEQEFACSFSLELVKKYGQTTNQEKGNKIFIYGTFLFFRLIYHIKQQLKPLQTLAFSLYKQGKIKSLTYSLIANWVRLTVAEAMV